MKTKLFLFFALALGALILGRELIGNTNNVNNEESEELLVEIITTPTQIPTIQALTPTPISLTPTPFPTPTPTPKPSPEPEPDSYNLSSLKTLFEKELKNYPNYWVSICVTDLQTQEIICIDGDTQRDTGCVIDLFALFVAVEEFEAGRAEPQDYLPDVGTSLASQIRAGIGGSSPNNAAIFLKAVKDGSLREGTYRAREIVAELGLKDTIFGYVPYNPVEVDFPPNLSTPRDINRALTKLWNGEIFSAKWTAYTIGVLTDSPRYLNSMPDLIQWKGAKVAHKVGYFGYESGFNFAVWNDVGIIYWEKDGKLLAFALSFFSKGPWAAKDLVAKLADISFDHFNKRY